MIKIKKKVEEYLKKHYGKKSRKEISEKLGIPVRTISTYAKRLGLTRKVRNNSEKHKRIRENPSKNNYAEWGRELGMARQNVYSFMKKNNLPPRYTDLTPLMEVVRTNPSVSIKRMAMLTGYNEYEVRKAKDLVILENYRKMKEKYSKVFENDKEE